MKKLVNDFLTMTLTASVVFLIIGAILLIMPELTLSVICYGISIILIVNGLIMASNSYKVLGGISLLDGFTWGILSIIIGLFIAVNKEIFISIIPVMLGIWMIINSCFKMRVSMAMLKDDEFSSALVMAITTLLCGTFLLFNPVNSAELITRILGIVIMVYSTLDLLGTTTFKRNIKKIEKIFKD